MIKIINENIQKNIVDLKQVHALPRIYASVNDSKNELVFLIINKGEKKDKIVLEPLSFDMPDSFSMQSYSGKDPHDVSPAMSAWKRNKIKDRKPKLELKPLSLNVIIIKSKRQKI